MCAVPSHGILIGMTSPWTSLETNDRQIKDKKTLKTQSLQQHAIAHW